MLGHFAFLQLHDHQFVVGFRVTHGFSTSFSIDWPCPLLTILGDWISALYDHSFCVIITLFRWHINASLVGSECSRLDDFLEYLFFFPGSTTSLFVYTNFPRGPIWLFEHILIFQEDLCFNQTLLIFQEDDVCLLNLLFSRKPCLVERMPFSRSSSIFCSNTLFFWRLFSGHKWEISGHK